MFAEQSLLVTEVSGARRLLVTIPCGLALPNGFKRPLTSHRAQ